MPTELAETRSQKRLQQWIAADPGTRTSTYLATLLEVSQPAVSKWIGGRARPDHYLRLAIEVLTEGAVPAEGWLTREETKKVARVKPLRLGLVG